MDTSNSDNNDQPPAPPGQARAVAAESLYLLNLLVAPGIAFLILGWLFLHRNRDTEAIARAHLEQTFFASLWAGVLLVLVNVVILLLGGYQAPYTWVVLITYFTACHSALVVLGMVGLAKAMAGRCYRFPLVGRALPADCERL